jgi:hypothetical protein
MTTAELLGLGVNGSLALITGLYAVFTFRILKANQRVADEMALQRRDILRPIISVGPQVDEYLVVSLLIKNSGSSPATNLKLGMDSDFYSFAEYSESHNLKGISAFNNPISAFAAGSELRFDLAQGFNLGQSKDGKSLTPMKFKISAQYEFGLDKFDEDFHIDLGPYMRSSVPRSKLIDELEKARKALETIASKST